MKPEQKKTALIVGVTGIVGRNLAELLGAQSDWHVIGLARSREAARFACERVGGSSTAGACDLANLDSVNAACATVVKPGRSLDAIVGSAGVMGSTRLEVHEGVELQFLINYVKNKES